jgi:hypothetical protein
MIRTLAKKLFHIEAFSSPPQQSDYSARWAGDHSIMQEVSATKRLLRAGYSFVPEALRMRVDERRNRFNLSNRRFFTPLR